MEKIPVNASKPSIPSRPPRDCMRCRYVHVIAPIPPALQGTPVCRFGPPPTQGIPQQNRLTGEILMALQASERPVNPGFWCYQFAESAV